MKIHFLPLFLCLSLIVTYFSLSSSNNSSPAIATKKSARNRENIQKGDGLKKWINSQKKKSQAHRINNDTDSAIYYLDYCIDNLWRQPSTEDEYKELGWIYVNRAYLYDQIVGDYLQAKKDYLSGLAQFNRCGYEDFYVARFVYQPLGNIYTRLEENEQAIRMLERFMRISKENGDSEAVLNAYNDLSRVHMNKSEYAKSIELIQKGLSSENIDDYNIGLLASSLAESYLYDHQIDIGIDAANKSIIYLNKITSKLDSTDYRHISASQYEIGALIVLGNLLTEKGEYKKAHGKFNTALLKANLIYAPKHRKKTKIHLGIANNYIRSKQYDEAISSYHAALSSAILDFNTTDISKLPKQLQLYAEISIGQALIGKSRTLVLKFEETNDYKLLDEALTTYLCYFDWEDLLRREHQDTYSKLQFASAIHKIGKESLKVISLLHKNNPKENYGEIAFRIIDEVKGKLLSESRGQILNSSFIKNTPEIKKLNELKMQLSLFSIELNDLTLVQDTVKVKSLQQNIETLDQEYQITLFNIRKKIPSYDELLYSENDTLQLSLLQEYLTTHNADLLNYFVSDSSIFLVSVHNNDIDFHSINTDDFSKSFDDFMYELSSPKKSTSATYQQKASLLYSLLIPKSNRYSKNENLIIVPDGDLNKLPFEALTITTNNTNSPNFKTLPYLIKNRSIQYAPTTNFLLRSIKKTKHLEPFLGIAPVFKNNKKHSYLKQSKKEVRAGNKVFNGVLRTHKKATKKYFLDNIEKYKLLHIVTHAGAGKEGNNNSWMAFHSGNTSVELITPELYQLDLSTELIILNACETGKGEYYEGEGELSIARGFIDAGAQNLITNLWKVNHASNSTLIQHFYQELAKNKTPSKALSLAKLNYLDDENIDNYSAHPYFWASPIFIGTSDQISMINETQEFSVYIWIGIILISIIAIYIIFRRYIRKQST